MENIEKDKDENRDEDKELTICKIIEKYPGIHHRELLRIIDDRGAMAKKTAEKYIKILIKNEKIFFYKYGKEIQYVLSVGQRSEKYLKKLVPMILKIFKNELESIEREFDNYDFDAKEGLPSYLIDTFECLSEKKSYLLKYAKENKVTDMSYARELYYEIRKLAPYHSTDDEILNEKRRDAAKIKADIGETQRDCAELLEKRRKMGASKSRNAITSKIKQTDCDIKNLYARLIAIRDELKSKNKT